MPRPCRSRTPKGEELGRHLHATNTSIPRTGGCSTEGHLAHQRPPARGGGMLSLYKVQKPAVDWSKAKEGHWCSFPCTLEPTHQTFPGVNFDKMGVYTKLVDEIQEVDVIIAGGEWLPASPSESPIPLPPARPLLPTPREPVSANCTSQAARRHASSLRGWPRPTPSCPSCSSRAVRTTTMSRRW